VQRGWKLLIREKESKIVEEEEHRNMTFADCRRNWRRCRFFMWLAIVMGRGTLE
jgi:hypothetical protein